MAVTTPVSDARPIQQVARANPVASARPTVGVKTDRDTYVGVRKPQDVGLRVDAFDHAIARITLIGGGMATVGSLALMWACGAGSPLLAPVIGLSTAAVLWILGNLFAAATV